LLSVTAKKLVADLGSLPPIPHIAAQVLKLTSDPDCSVSELQRVIGSDQALTAQILKIANSATFGMMREVRTLPQAIMTLGLNAVKSVVVASSAKDLYMHGKPTHFQVAIWEHSLVAALAGRAFGKIFRFPGYDEVFLGGLLHDIGKSVLYFKFPDRFETILQSVHSGKILDSLAEEQECFGFDHTMVGEVLLDAWNLPPTFSQCVRWHHSPKSSDEESLAMTAFVALGNVFAIEAGKGIGGPEGLESAKRDALELAGLTEDSLAARREEVLEFLEQDKVLIKGF
jgi:HD-like signal output (HDOD) protein